MISGIVTRDTGADVIVPLYQQKMSAHSQLSPSGQQMLKWNIFLQFIDEEKGTWSTQK